MRKAKVFLLAFLVLVIVMFGGAFWYYTENQKAVTSESDVVQFYSDQQSLEQTITKLKQENIIKDELVAKIVAKLNGFDKVFEGTYEIDRAWDTVTILQYLQDVDHVLHDHVFRMTFVEGQWAKDFAKIIANHTNYSEQEVIDYWNNETVVKALIDQYEVLTDAVLNPQTYVKLEGYFAPDTYEFYRDASLADITKTLLDPSEQFYLTNKSLFDNSKYSVHQLFTLASIVQFEAGKPADQQVVAAVFFNRLAIDMKLESSVTLCYANYKEINWQNCESDATIDSPYNTYLYAGFPIGPIANVSKTALLAVLEPVSTDYFFFIADIYGDGTVYYAKTYEEHLENVRKYLHH